MSPPSGLLLLRGSRPLRRYCSYPPTTAPALHRQYSQPARELRLLVSAITPDDQQLAARLIDSLRRQHDGSVSVTCIGDALVAGKGCSVLHPEVPSAAMEAGGSCCRA
jgi:hypothetical protein